MRPRASLTTPETNVNSWSSRRRSRRCRSAPWVLPFKRHPPCEHDRYSTYMYICNYKMSLQNPMVMSLQYWCNGEGWWREQHMSWACWATTTWWQKSAHHAVAALNCKRWTTRSDTTVMPAKCLWMSLRIMLTEENWENCTTILRFSILHILPMHFKSKRHKTSRRAAFIYTFSV